MKITPEEIKKIADQLPHTQEMKYNEYLAIKAAAGLSAFAIARHAYALGFTRGSAKDMA